MNGISKSETETDRCNLVLTRKANESIVIDNSIEITVYQIRGGKVRFGIVAPRSVKILRREIKDREVQ